MTSFFALVVWDIRYGLRLMRRSLPSTLVAITVLAIGIGANTAIFSMVNKVLLEPLPYPQPDRLVQLLIDSPMGRATLTSVPKFIVWREARGLFPAIAAFTAVEPLALRGEAGPEIAMATRVSADYFPVFAPTLVRGRFFTAAEDVPNGAPVALISQALWQRRFGAARRLEDLRLQIDDRSRSYEVIGVVAQDVWQENLPDIWLPLQADPNSLDHTNRLQVVARMAPGATVEMARRQMWSRAGVFHKKFPGAMGPLESFTAVALRDMLVGEARVALFLLLGAVLFVLFIACANVANLLLAQGSNREREIAIRVSLGAGPRRIVRQVLTESLLLSCAGGLAGLVMGVAGSRALVSLSPGSLPLVGGQDPLAMFDWRVLVFTLTIALGTGVLFGLYPGMHAVRLDLTTTLRASSGQSAVGRHHGRLPSALVVVQMAFAVVLLVGSGLLIRTFVATRTVEPGFQARDVLTLEMPLSGARYATTREVARLVTTVEQRLQALPDVAAAAAASSLPLEPGSSLAFIIDRRPLTRASYHGLANWRSVSRRYFDVLRIPLLRGRAFSEHDNGAGSPVAIVNDAMARKFWPGQSPLQERITIGRGVRPEIVEPTRTIVGVVADVRDTGLNRDPEPMVYVPIAQVSDGMNAFNNQTQSLRWIVRTSVQPRPLRGPIARELRASSGGLPVGRVRTMEDVVERSTAATDFNTVVLGLFAGVALALAAIGLYGVVAYSVQQRTREIGVRMALGASPRDVWGMVLSQGMRLTLVGLGAGLLASLGLTQSMVSLIYGVKTSDPLVFAVVVVVLTAVAIVATLLPAHRATRVPPTEALRRG